jgi:ATP-dependent RNA helicase DDX19/DBP5
MAQFLPYIRVAYAVRDPTMSKKHNLVRGQLLTEPIVIGTPGTVEDWCYRLRVINLSKLRICCVDESDVMIAMQGSREVCVKLVNGLDISNCQMMVFSTTYSDDVMIFAREIVPDPVVLRLKREKQMLTNIKQFFIRCYDPEHKYYAVQQIYAQITVGQATKATARELAIRMAEEKHSVRELTAALDIEQRAAIIKQFREGIFRVLILTNITVSGKFIFIIFFLFLLR